MDVTSSSPPGVSSVLSSSANAPNRRKSGRAVKKPDKIYPGFDSPSSEGKRKRTASDEEDPGDEQDASEDDSAASEGEADEEELKEKKKKTARAKKVAPKHAAKKPKITNGAATKQLALRPAKSAPTKKKPRKQPIKASAAMKAAASADNSTGLYAEVFAKGHSVDAVAAEWTSMWDQDNVNAMRDLINFVLKCTGCDLQIDGHDIEDPDNVTGRLTDLQEEYQALKVTEYPLIIKARGNASFRTTLTAFFGSLTSTIHASSVLYNEPPLFETIQEWVVPMSSSALRPFRHTATVILLAIVSELCRIANEIADTKAKTLRQIQGEKKKSRVNQDRVASMQQNIEKGDQNQQIIEEKMDDIFKSVFVHRYRDVDPKIRVECVQSLGDWIITYPDTFFSPEKLRYLGWLLSDISTPTRQEVIKQLQRLFNNKENFGRLRTWTERFRPRIVEIATRDAEPNVRAASVELLDSIREAGMLEPDDVDTIGKLIFDSEPKVRKAVVGFFTENINDLYKSKVEEFNGEDQLVELLEPEEEDGYDLPRVSWLKLKSLVEVLQSYDSDDSGELPSQVQRGHVGARNVLVAAGVESRFTLAAQALYDTIPEVKEWEILAGYLLFDHTAIETDEKVRIDDVEKMVHFEFQLDEREEVILLEVLNAAVKLRITQAVDSDIDKKGKKSKSKHQDSIEVQETTARHLAELIPKLLNKFGPIPAAASAVLRLEHVLNLQIFQDLRQDSTSYSSLLDDINKQFMSHEDQTVLVEASAALLHAKNFEELEEITDGKLQLLWESNIDTLHAILKGKDPESRENLSNNALTELSNTVRRISNLASISDCTELLETAPTSAGKKRQNDTSPSDPLSLLLSAIKRGAPGESMDADANALEDSLVLSAQKTSLFYFMWKVRSLQIQITSSSPIPDTDIDALQDRRAAFIDSLHHVLSTRPPNDDLSFATAGTVLDIATLFATLRHTPPTSSRLSSSSQKPSADYTHVKQQLIQQIPSSVETLITKIFSSAEKTLAKKSRRKLEVALVDDDAEPLDSDVESETADDNEDEEDKEEGNEERKKEELVAEQKLCELTGKIVLAIIARVINAPGDGNKGGKLRDRVGRNRGVLGANFKEVVGFLDGKGRRGVVGREAGRVVGRAKEKAKAEKKGSRKEGLRSGKETSERVVVVEEDDDDDEGREEDAAASGEEGDDEDLRRRELIVDDDGSGELQHEGDVNVNEDQDENEEIMGD